MVIFAASICLFPSGEEPLFGCKVPLFDRKEPSLDRKEPSLDRKVPPLGAKVPLISRRRPSLTPPKKCMAQILRYGGRPFSQMRQENLPSVGSAVNQHVTPRLNYNSSGSWKSLLLLLPLMRM
jgi:hypothetical protein